MYILFYPFKAWNIDAINVGVHKLALLCWRLTDDKKNAFALSRYFEYQNRANYPIYTNIWGKLVSFYGIFLSLSIDMC